MFVVIASNQEGLSENPDIWYQDMLGCVLNVHPVPDPSYSDRYKVVGLPKFWVNECYVFRNDVEEVKSAWSEDTKFYYA